MIANVVAIVNAVVIAVVDARAVVTAIAMVNVNAQVPNEKGAAIPKRDGGFETFGARPAAVLSCFQSCCIAERKRKGGEVLGEAQGTRGLHPPEYLLPQISKKGRGDLTAPLTIGWFI